MHRVALPVVFALLLSACAGSSSQVSEAPHAAAALPQALEKVADSGLVLKGNEWYANDRFGFALQIPPKLTNPGGCTLTDVPAEGYRVLAFEDGDSIYLAPSVYGALIEKMPGDSASGHDCVRINNTLPTIRKHTGDALHYRHGWRIAAAQQIANDAQLSSFVRTWYGQGCTLGTKTPTLHESTLDVEIADCTLPAGYALKYAPAAHVAVTWVIGEESGFDGLDQRMSETFRFE